jgi:hypothetical protein
MDINFFEIWNTLDDSAGSNPSPPQNERILQENNNLVLQEGE